MGKGILIKSRFKKNLLKLLKFKYLILTSIALMMLLYADYLTYKRFSISIITVIFGVVPFFIQLSRTLKNSIKL